MWPFPSVFPKLAPPPFLWGVGYIKDLAAFTAWMAEDPSRATLETPPGSNIVKDRDFHKLAQPHVGYLREFYNHQGYQDCCEYWAPLGSIDTILSQKLKQQITVDRETLAHWLLNVFRIEDGVSTTQYAFRVLEVPHGDLACYFWRTNQPKGKFLHCGDPDWQKQQEDRRRQQSAHRAKEHQARQQNTDAWAGYRSDRSGRAGGYSWGASGAQSYPWSKDNSRPQGSKWS